MKADDAKRLKELEKENAQLKRLVADKELENLALREIVTGNGEPVAATPCRPHAPAAARPFAAAGAPDRTTSTARASATGPSAPTPTPIFVDSCGTSPVTTPAGAIAGPTPSLRRGGHHLNREEGPASVTGRERCGSHLVATSARASASRRGPLTGSVPPTRTTSGRSTTRST